MAPSPKPSQPDLTNAALADISYLVREGEKPSFNGQDIFLKRFLLALEAWLPTVDPNFHLLVTTGSILLGNKHMLPSGDVGLAIVDGYNAIYSWSAPSPSRVTAKVTGS